MVDKTRFPYKDAMYVAENITCFLESENCVERVEIAGSLRRGKESVGDIEILCIPRLQYTLDMFGEESSATDLLDATITKMIEAGFLEKRGGYGQLNKMLRHQPSGIPVDVFSTTVDHWGMALMVRTGSAEFNVKVMQRLKDLGHRGHAYGYHEFEVRGKKQRTASSITLNAYTPDESEIMCPTESGVFQHLQWPYEPPERRG